LVECDAVAEQDKETVLKFTQEWLGRYVREALEPLFKLQDDDIADGAATQIAQKLHDALGILPREDLQELIGQMAEEERATLRSKKIRFGPLIVYLPELNKPAAVRLRAMLLSLWDEKELPAQAPPDGIVSFSVEGKDIDPSYYRAIGYPVYGPRSMRVDMLDRVICAVYDTAKEGKFQAQHQMAEWLGSNIADLYAILEAMGHKKIYDPADAIKTEEASAENTPSEKEEGAVNPSEPSIEEASAQSAAKSEVQAAVEKPKEILKPELATFVLKRGKAIQGTNQAPASSRPNKKFSDKNFSSDKKKFNKKKSTPKKQPQQRIYKAEVESNPEDSPFAILSQLKVSDKE
jgi:ATP-dependent RNA helicase SUPV3L1/SUV3